MHPNFTKTRRTSQPRKSLSYCSPDRRNSKRNSPEPVMRSARSGDRTDWSNLQGQVDREEKKPEHRVPLNHGRNIRFSRVCLAEIESDIGCKRSLSYPAGSEDLVKAIQDLSTAISGLEGDMWKQRTHSRNLQTSGGSLEFQG